MNSPGTPTRSGYSFAGWFTASSGGSAISFPFAHGQTANFTLYAQWTADTYAVTYNGNTNGGGAAPSDGTAYASGATVTVAGNTGLLTKTGYTFDGWCTTQPSPGSACSGTSRAAATTFTLSSHTTLYAVWTADTYAVSYYGNGNGGGSVPASQTKTYAVDLTLASNSGSLTKAGYTFDGWCSTQPAAGSACGGTSYAAGATYSANAAATLYAVWISPSCSQGGECLVGDTGPGGGVVFYVHASGTFACGPTGASTCRYLEAAPTSGTNAWTDANYRWSGVTDTAIGPAARYTAVGTGYRNTEAIVAQSGTADRAGTVTRAYRGPNNLTDWYLPSKDELNELCKYARQQTDNNPSVRCSRTSSIRSGFSESTMYGSSTEGTNADGRHMQYFDYGDQLQFVKASVALTRAIRAF
jgi:uncharacterized repeat protein (TIGR02543 family)